MAIVLDHTIVPVHDRDVALEFYTRIFGFQDLGEVGPFLAVRVNEGFNLDFASSDDFKSIHYAFTTHSLWTRRSSKRPSPGYDRPGFPMETAPLTWTT